MKGIETICTYSYNLCQNVSDGVYDIKYSNDVIEFEGEKFTYLSSGLARIVFISEDGKWVIKVPIADRIDDDDIKMYLENDRNFKRFSDVSISHNYYEAIAYQECPEEYKKYLAETILLKNCWVKQEYVNVKKCLFRSDFREIGQRNDGSFCIFDYDPLLDDFTFDGYDWKRLPKLIEEATKEIK